jgi:hypothetical protein
VVKIAGSVDDSMHFNLSATNYVKHEVGLDDKDAIPIFTKFLVTWYPSK